MFEWMWDWIDGLWEWLDNLRRVAWAWVVDLFDPVRWLWGHLWSFLGDFFAYLFSGLWIDDFIAWAVAQAMANWPEGIAFLRDNLSDILAAIEYALAAAGWLGYVINLPAFLIVAPIILFAETIALVVRIWRFVLSLIPVAR